MKHFHIERASTLQTTNRKNDFIVDGRELGGGGGGGVSVKKN